MQKIVSQRVVMFNSKADENTWLGYNRSTCWKYQIWSLLWFKDDADIRKIKSQYDLVYNDDDKVAEYARNKHII